MKRASTAVIVAALAAVVAFGVMAGCGDSEEERAAAEPTAGKWKTWVLGSPSEVRLAPPPKAGSAAASRDAAQLKAAVAGRGPAEESAARRFTRAPVVRPWLEQNMRLVSYRAKDVPASSRAYSNVSVAMYDAVVAASYWKYVFRRKAPEGDSLVPRSPDPSYPSEHAAIAGAASRVLAYL